MTNLVPITTRDNILTQIFNHPKVNEAIGKMEPVELRDELKQELGVILCKIPDEKLFEMNKTQYLLAYSLRSIVNMAKSGKSSFFYKFRKPLQTTISFEPWHEQLDVPRETNHIDIHTEISNLPEDEQTCIRYYMKERRVSTVIKETGLPKTEAKKTVTRAMDKIKARANGINLNNVIRCKVEFEVFLSKVESTDDIMDAMDELTAYLKQTVENQTISDKLGTFIHKVKEARLR